MPREFTDISTMLQSAQETLTDELIDSLAFTAQFGHSETLRLRAQDMIVQLAQDHGIYCASLFDLYKARAHSTWSSFSVPACNIRTLTYHTSCVFHEAIIKHSMGPVVFEIALSEQEYTSQTHREYASAILAGALKAGYIGPIFLLGDHYQVRSEAFRADKESEVKRLEECIRSALSAQFYSIDIDGSTVVNLELPDEKDQQKDNYEITAHLTKKIRAWQPADVTVAIGGEIGHIGGVNSTEADFEAFMDGFSRIYTDTNTGLSKIALQTGTSHGGTPLQDGTIKEVAVDTILHQKIGSRAREKYELGGTVQHGASTLPDDMFHLFPDTGTLEVHLSTGWQNTVYDALPSSLRENMYAWIKSECAKEHKPDMTMEQFIYKSRKKAFGPFKRELWHLPEAELEPILSTLSAHFVRVATQLNICNQRHVIDSIYTK